MPEGWVGNNGIESGLQGYQEGAPNSTSPSKGEQQLAPNKFAMNMNNIFGLCNTGKLLPLKLSGGMSAIAAGSSTNYELQEMSMRCSVAKLDSPIESWFASVLMQNKSLSLRYITHTCQAMVPQRNSAEMSISLVRAYSRLNRLFIVFQGSSAADTPNPNKHQTI